MNIIHGTGMSWVFYSSVDQEILFVWNPKVHHRISTNTSFQLNQRFKTLFKLNKFVLEQTDLSSVRCVGLCVGKCKAKGILIYLKSDVGSTTKVWTFPRVNLVSFHCLLCSGNFVTCLIWLLHRQKTLKGTSICDVIQFLLVKVMLVIFD